jgi:RES domain-containing protein
MTNIDPKAVAKLPGSALSLVGYRNQATGFDPRSGEGARRFGGRFNPANSYPVIYLCSTRPCVIAELTRQARRQGLDTGDLLPRELWSLGAELTKVLDLTDPDTLASLQLQRADLAKDDLRLTQDLGEAAHEHGFQAVRSPSVTGVDDVIALLPENLAGTDLVAELIDRWLTAEDLKRIAY